MSWPRRHELLDVDLDAYADDDDTHVSDDAKPAQPQLEATDEQPRVSALEAAERAGIPLDALLPKLR